LPVQPAAIGWRSDLDDLIKEAREALALSHEFDRDNRREAMEDMHFVAGFQWSEAARIERKGRPMITINRSSQFLKQVSNPIRKNMPVIKVEPENDEQQPMAEIANGLFRRIQYNSSASHVYANAVEHMVACGIGWFRVLADYSGDDDFDQELLIKRVFNPMSVYPDPSSLEPDRSDMNWCLVSEVMPRKAFETKYPGKKADGFDAPSEGGREVDWGSADTVRVAEYWRRKPVTRKIAQLKNGQVVELTGQGAGQLEQLQKLGIIVNARDAKGYEVEMTLLSGHEQLEETYRCPCKWIPIIPVIGNEIPMDKGTYRHGLIRFQREPAQLQNYFLSVAAESMGQQPKTPYLLTPKQIGKFKSLWDTANTSPRPYLLYEPDTNVPGGQPTRVVPPPLPAGLVQFAQMMVDEQKAATGLYDASLGAQSNETSGVAIGARVEQGNEATFHFSDNLEHSLEHLGRVLLDMIPKVYDNQRTMRLKADDDTEKSVTINQPTIGYDGQDMVHNDLTRMDFKSVRVVMGPSYASRRQQDVQLLTQLAQSFPPSGPLVAPLVAKNLDIDGADKLAAQLNAMLPPAIQQIGGGGGQPGQPDGQPAGPPPPDPAQQAQEVQAQAQQQVMSNEVQASQFKTAQESAKAQAAAQAIQTEQAKTRAAILDGELKLKKLREPPPTPRSEANAGT
jgi:hypothetical protein